LYVTVFKYSVRNFSVTTLRSKRQLILAMTFIFLHAFHFKFTINANIVNIAVAVSRILALGQLFCKTELVMHVVRCFVDNG